MSAAAIWAIPAEELEEERVVLEPNGPLDDWTDMDLELSPPLLGRL